MTTPTTSTRFRRAASTERDRLVRQRAKVAAKAKSVREELEALETETHKLDERIDSLQALIGDRGVQVVERPAPQPADERHALAGSAIRRTAVRVLVSSGRAEAPIHYREWFELLHDAGYDVAGKRPDAVFLNQIARSPAVKTTTKAGLYELDQEAPRRLRQRLEELQHALSGLAVDAPSDPAELKERTTRQEELGLEIRRTQKTLTEATEGLGELDQQPAQLAA
jgi:DNA repair ATPase RecN